jgi:hypothetical protein
MKYSRSVWILAIGLLGIAVFLLPASAFAQGCALCYTQAAASGSRMIQALKSGILILIAPPTLGSLGLVFVCYRKRNNTRKQTGEFDNDWEEEQSEKW